MGRSSSGTMTRRGTVADVRSALPPEPLPSPPPAASPPPASPPRASSAPLLRVLGTFLGIGLPVVSALGYIALVGPWLPAQLRFRLPIAIATVIPIAMAATSVGEYLWRRVRLPGSGPIDHLPIKWPRSHCRKCRYAALVEEVALGILPLPVGAGLHALLSASETGGRRHGGGKEHSKRASRLVKHVGGQLAPSVGGGGGAGSMAAGGSQIQGAGTIEGIDVSVMDAGGGAANASAAAQMSRDVLNAARGGPMNLADRIRNLRDRFLHSSHTTALVIGPATAAVMTLGLATFGLIGPSNQTSAVRTAVLGQKFLRAPDGVAVRTPGSPNLGGGGGTGTAGELPGGPGGGEAAGGGENSGTGGGSTGGETGGGGSTGGGGTGGGGTGGGGSGGGGGGGTGGGGGGNPDPDTGTSPTPTPTPCRLGNRDLPRPPFLGCVRDRVPPIGG